MKSGDVFLHDLWPVLKFCLAFVGFMLLVWPMLYVVNRMDSSPRVEPAGAYVDWEDKTRRISDDSGVPLDRVHSMYEAEGRDAAAEQVIRARGR